MAVPAVAAPLTGSELMVRCAHVHAFLAHIACDARSASEIVIPWKNHHGTVVAVFDVDSSLPAAFDACDRANLMKLADSHRFD